jgi:RNA polymerase sigma-70 factor, ECF subfamily
MKEANDPAETLSSAVSGSEPPEVEACPGSSPRTAELRTPAGEVAPIANQHPEYPGYFVALYQRSGGEKFGLSLLAFAQILQEVGAKYLPSGAGEAELAEFHNSLHLEELALARACAQGSEPAWELFLNRYREKLYDAGEAIARDESVGRELADSLYADLFGTRERQAGDRISKLDSYTGRGSLEGWLRTTLAQEYVNRYRSQRRLVSLEEQVEAGAQFQAKESESASPDSRLVVAADEALSTLSDEERFILASYYLDERTLAEIAGTLGVHESTVSRRVDKTTKGLRKRIVRGLKERGMSAREAEEALEADVRDVVIDVRGRLVQEKDG